MSLSNTPGAPIWVDLFTTDTDTARSFYGDLFGWTSTPADPNFGGYFLFEHNGAPIAGCMENTGMAMAGAEPGPSGWSVYLESADAAATVTKAKASGGTVLYDAMDVGDLGVQAVLVDPGGARIGIWQPRAHQGITARGAVGAPAWFENLTTSYDEVVPFYAAVFDWVPTTMSDTPEFRYTTLGEGEGALAGIMDASGFLDGRPSTWQFYVKVADTDATVAQAVAAGATAVQPGSDTPYGRLGSLLDPAGVAFCVMGPNNQTA